jgi:molybdate-binding protein
MFTIDENTGLIGTTDLRTKISEVEDMKYEKLIIMNREKPIAVVMTFKQYQKNWQKMEDLEDLVLGYIAKDRSEKSSSKDFISLEKAAKKLGINI